jgi:hypothetical protein
MTEHEEQRDPAPSGGATSDADDGGHGIDDQDAEPTLTAEQVDADAERDQAEG